MAGCVWDVSLGSMIPTASYFRVHTSPNVHEFLLCPKCAFRVYFSSGGGMF